jgi:RNA 2',3'-cyclic 3'-phosphodiesterase
MARGATARLFVAADPPLAVREALAEWARATTTEWGAWSPRRSRRTPRVLKADAMHLTLCFLGSRPLDEVAELASAVGACAEHVGELALGAPLWLPPMRPRALAVEVHDRSGRLTALQASLTRGLSQASGWEPERRRFRPHITLVRMGMGVAPRGGAAGERPLLAATPQRRFAPESIVLYRSLPTSAGSVYEPLERCELGVGEG